MKRSRNEQIGAAVLQYLKKRQYTDSDVLSKRDLKLKQNLKEMAQFSTVCNEASSSNVISYSSSSGDVTAFDQQFTKLKTFIGDAVEPFRAELCQLLFPLFIHIYLELTCNGHKTPAHKFYSRHQSIFLESLKFKADTQDLLNVCSAQDIPSYPNINTYREKKFTVKFSRDTFQYLLRYLKSGDNMMLLQLFTHHIEVKVNESNKSHLHLYEERNGEKDFSNLATPPHTPENKVIINEISLSSLQQCIKKVHDGPPCLPSICQYSIINAFQGLSSLELSKDVSKLAAGFEDSSIRVWSLIPKLLNSTSAKVDVSRVHLACDTITDDDIVHRQPDEVQVLRGHSGTVYSLGFSSDKKTLLSCSEDTTVRAWSMTSFTNIAVYRGHNYPVWSIDVSPFGMYFVTGSQDKTARLWTLDRLYPLRIFSGHNMDVDCVKFHPNCNYVASGSSDKTVRLWSIQDGRLVRIFQGHKGSIFALAFAPSGQYVASAGEDRRVKIWDLGSGSLIKELRGHTETVYSLCFNRDSTMLASGGLDGIIRIWDIRKGPNNNNVIDGHTSPELLAAYPSKLLCLQLMQYTSYNLLYTAGATSAPVTT